MKNRPWFAARSQAETRVGFVQSLFAPWFRPTPPVEVLDAHSPSRFADYGADAGWTASLRRGDGLPPFLLCIDIAAGERTAMRFEPFSRRNTAESRVREL
jgi:hypothetical protein